MGSPVTGIRYQNQKSIKGHLIARKNPSIAPKKLVKHLNSQIFGVILWSFFSVCFSLFFPSETKQHKKASKHPSSTGPKDDYYLNLLDWSAEDHLAVGREARGPPHGPNSPQAFHETSWNLIGSVMGEKIPEQEIWITFDKATVSQKDGSDVFFTRKLGILLYLWSYFLVRFHYFTWWNMNKKTSRDVFITLEPQNLWDLFLVHTTHGTNGIFTVTWMVDFYGKCR